LIFRINVEFVFHKQTQSFLGWSFRAYILLMQDVGEVYGWPE